MSSDERAESGHPVIPAMAQFDDRVFFKEHRDRKLRIREPIGEEYRNEFRGFGMHEEHRRRVIVSRVSPSMAKRHNVDFLRVAFLLFADETVEDTDEVLEPILRQIMSDAADGYGMKRR
jgi:hypothetical protein